MRHPEAAAERNIYLSYRREGYTKEEAYKLLAIPMSISTWYRWERWFKVENESRIHMQSM